MRKRPFTPAKGVSNIELFYDLVFVYCISVLTSLVHHVHGDFLDLSTWLIYLFSFLVVLQIWFYTTLLMNRYGERSAEDNICLFINMFLLYFLANGIQTDWNTSIFTFNIAWAAVLVNLIVHWIIKLVRYSNLDDDDCKIIHWNIFALAAQLVIVLIASFLSGLPGEIVSWSALLFGCIAWRQPKVYAAKPSRFSHITERCSLLVIVAFGETVVAIAPAVVTESKSMLYSIFVFALVVGLFLIYIYEHDNMIDHHRKTDGIAYMGITAWIILTIGNLTIALEYMVMDEIAYFPKSLMLMGCLIAYLLTSFLLVRYNKPEFHYSIAYVVGRLVACAFIAIAAFASNFDPFITLVCDVIAVYLALLHEWMLYRGRMSVISLGRSIGFYDDESGESDFTFETREGRKAIAQATREALKEKRQELGSGGSADTDQETRR